MLAITRSETQSRRNKRGKGEGPRMEWKRMGLGRAAPRTGMKAYGGGSPGQVCKQTLGQWHCCRFPSCPGRGLLCGPSLSWAGAPLRPASSTISLSKAYFLRTFMCKSNRARVFRTREGFCFVLSSVKILGGSDLIQLN